MTEMIMRVADVIASGMAYDLSPRQIAKKAIEAMRGPTSEMTQADNVHWDYSCHVCGGAKEHWESMIDAALKQANAPHNE